MSPYDVSPSRLRGRKAVTWRDYRWGESAKFIACNAVGIGAAVAGLWLGAPASAWICALVLYVVRMFFVTGGYHRYFSHRSFKTGRIMQFVFAFGASTSAERGVLWWAAHHRDHHRYSDTERDVHSPVRWGFWHAQVMWFFDDNDRYDPAKIRDFVRYPELVVIDRLWLVPPTILALACLFFLGWWGYFIGFFFSTVMLWHGTFTINSLSHLWGRRRYATSDHSRNNAVLALLTLGEGWHNNHHHCMNSCRQGFFWWEIDVTYYVLRAMSWVGLVWDLKPPPPRIYEAGPAPQPGAERLPSRLGGA
ncbi:MAG: acyl-CoA desaturase [Myxococcales bacterium]|nr:acyl-CoA desaturase [Myxococcales bacterium]